ncbi:MAG: hypothetical protein OEY59_05490 [Deltaproteobacteria bacterium]|nr:hypothetical protein [Deltaproteobacteria bacterium]
MEFSKFFQDQTFYQSIQRIVMKLELSAGKERELFPLLVTSAVSGEGKTMVALAFSMIIAIKSNQRCLLVDGNWNKPQMHKWFNLKQEFTITEYLENPLRLVQPSGIDNLDILVAPPEAAIRQSDFIYSQDAFKLNENFKCAVETLLKEYKITLFDSSAVTTQSKQILDPLFLSSLMESVIMVIMAVKTQKHIVKRALFSLESFNKNIQAVCNNRSNWFYRPSKNK